MLILFIIGILAGFVLAVKLWFWVLILLWLLCLVNLLHSELEDFLVGCCPMTGATIGIVLGWAHYYVHYQPTTGWTISKLFTWLVTP